MDDNSDYEDPEGFVTSDRYLNWAQNEPPQLQTERKQPGRLPRVSVHLLHLLVSLGLFLLLVTVLVQITRIHQSLQSGTAELTKGPRLDKELDVSGSGSGLGEVELPRQLIQADLRAIHKQLARMMGTLDTSQDSRSGGTVKERLCRSCPWIWTQFQGSCYLLFRSKRSWSDAFSACQAVNAQLVVIDSEAEEKFLQSWKVRIKKPTWIGLSDSHQEGTWRWVDDTPLRSSFWKEGEPNNSSDEDCVELQDDGWNDSQCIQRKVWICEKPSLPCLRH